MSGSGGGWWIKAFLTLLAALLVLSGCSGSDNGLSRQAITGTVFLDGRRLAQGSILFEPEDRPLKGDTSILTGNVIVNGRFLIPRRYGLTPGLYKIMIFSVMPHREEGKTGLRDDAANPGLPSEEKVPAKFNAQTELELEFTEGIKDLTIAIESK